MTVDQLWAGWRSEYVAGVHSGKSGCVFCELFASKEPGEVTNIVWRNDLACAILNRFPYGTGHLLVMPLRHVGELHDLDPDESRQLWASVNDAADAVRAAYRPDGMNVGFNLGEGSGAGVPGHLHAHVLPRWKSDTNFMTAVANTKVLPEALDVTHRKLTDHWPQS